MLMSGEQLEQDHPLQEFTSHITNIGKMIEDMEIKMRNLLQEVRPPSIPQGYITASSHPRLPFFLPFPQVYFGKTRDVVFDLRSLEDLEKSRMQRELQKELLGSLGKR